MEGGPDDAQAGDEAMRSEARRPELDWVRVLAFGLLIPFHAGLGFLPTNPYGFSNDQHGGHGLVVALLWTHQWRLPLLFLVAGMGTAFAFRLRGRAAFAQERARRILVPLIAGTLLLLPLHTYVVGVQVGHPLVRGDGFAAFMVRWLGQTALLPVRFVEDPKAPWTHVQHLWFLLNVFLYSMVFLVTTRFANRGARLRSILEDLLRRRPAHLIGLLALPLLVVEFALKPAFRGDIGTGYELPWYFLFFLYGLLLVQAGPAFWRAIVRVRWPALLMGAVAMTGFTATLVLADGHDVGYGTRIQEGGWIQRGDPWMDGHSALSMFFHSLNSISWVLAFVAWTAHLLRRGSPALGYLNAAHYTSYIVHMSFVLIGLAAVRRVEAWWPLELAAVTLFAAGGVLAFYEVARRWRLTRLLFAARRPPSRRPNS